MSERESEALIFGRETLIWVRERPTGLREREREREKERETDLREDKFETFGSNFEQN